MTQQGKLFNLGITGLGPHYSESTSEHCGPNPHPRI